MKGFLTEDFLLTNDCGTASLPRVCRRRSRFSTTTVIFSPLTSPRIGGSRICSRSGLREITTSGGRCAPTASTEKYCTGDATPYEKFLAWARTVPYTLRNPLYHWTHLELQRYFGITELLDEASAPAIWERGECRILAGELTAHAILQKFRVEVVCTTDDPIDDLAASSGDREVESADASVSRISSGQSACHRRSGVCPVGREASAGCER